MANPPAPAGWNKTLADLFDEMRRGERGSVGGPEVEWAREYERSLLPAGLRFPCKGDIYEAIDEVCVDYLTAWSAPYTGGGTGTLMKGDRVVIDVDPGTARPISAYAAAVDAAALEPRIVPMDDRTSPKYAGFYFSLKTVDLNRKFRLIEKGSVPTIDTNGAGCVKSED